MAGNKEALVIILDVGKNSLQKDPITEETFVEKQKSCCTKILQRKMFTSKKDEVGIILLGSVETDNELNRKSEGYDHICEALPLAIPNWDMVRLINKNVNHEGADGDWLDALVVAMDLIRREKEAKKFANCKIVLFSTFSTLVNDDQVSFIMEGLRKLEIELVVISDNIEISNTDQKAATFSQKENKSEHQKESENLVKKIIEETDGNMCNFEIAIHHLMNFQRRKTKPWYWNSNLTIGNDIKIQISGMIGIKDETHFKWETESATEGTTCRLDTEHFKNGEKIEPAKEDILNGYMLGSTPIAFDKTLGYESEPTKKGLRCVLFTPKSYLLQEYLAGNGTYIFIPKQGATSSEKMFAALVNAMEKNGMVMIATRTYADNNKPKLVTLIPNFEREIPCLTMIELFYADQYFYWDFPLLKGKKTEPTEEQYAAVEKLIDSMDLMDVADSNGDKKEAFPSHSLLNISSQYIYETVTDRALNPKKPVPTLDGRLLETLKIPKKIRENSAEFVQKIKELFPLEEIKKPGKRETIRKIGDIPAQPDDVPQVGASISQADIDKYILTEVGTIAPAEDFILLIKDGHPFTELSKQIRNVIMDLLFKSMTGQGEKIAKAMMAFREEAKFHAPWEYNDWIKELKDIITTRKKINFWQNIVVKDQLGLIPTSESDLIASISDEEAAEFYRLNTTTTPADDADGDDSDDLFDNM